MNTYTNPNKIQFLGKTVGKTESKTLYDVETYEVGVTRGVESKLFEKTMKPDDFIEITYDDNTTWLGTTEEYSRIFASQSDLRTITTTGSDTVLSIPHFLEETREGDRGLLGKIALKILKLFIRKTNVVGESVLELAKKFEDKKLEKSEGLYLLSENFTLEKAPDPKEMGSENRLLFIHGTASSTQGSFEDLKVSVSKSAWSSIFENYNKSGEIEKKQNVLCFQHRTLTKSPIENLYDLVLALPAKVKLDIVTHSRGGFVGELLVRFTENSNGFDELFLEASELPDKDKILIKDIRKLLLEKEITVEKFVRVACPGGGTSLMGQRVEHIFNVLINLFNYSMGATAAAPFVDILKDLILTAVEQKNNTHILPGLQAMDPASAFVKLLRSPIAVNDLNLKLKNQLFVISGSGELNPNLKGLGVLLSRLVFLDKNDFVVNTKSMYHCSPRMQPLLYCYDENNNVSHFNYFKNPRTQEALKNALLLPIGNLKEFKTYTTVTSDEDVRGLIEYGNIFRDEVSGNKSIVVLLPGIMGSTLDIDNKRFWINYLRFVSGGLAKLDVEKPFNVKAVGLIATSYKKLMEYLLPDYDVVTFPYDWRNSVPEAGKLLIQKVKQIKQKLDESNKTKNTQYTLSILAHSMGGLVARELAFQDKALWDELNQQKDFRMILLGTPWLGSYRIPYVLAGKDSMVKTLEGIDPVHNMNSLINIFAKFKGLLHLLPIEKDGAEHDFTKEDTWRKFIDQLGMKWQIPDSNLRNDFKKFRETVLNFAPQIGYDKIIYVAGKDKQTQCNYFDINGRIEFENTPRGDQSVTWDSGIPQNLNRKQNLYYVEVSHGALACEKILFNGIKELLKNGSTNDAAFRRSEASRSGTTQNANFLDRAGGIVSVDEGSVVHTLLGIPEEEKQQQELPPLAISIVNGDLKMSNSPLIIGHFNRDGILLAEAVADKYLGGALSTKFQLGVYPGPLHTHELFLPIASSTDPFKGAIVIGLGEYENFTPQLLSQTVEKACISYLLKINGIQESIPISSLLVGSNYGQLSVGSSVLAILLGIHNANRKVRAIKPENPLIEEVEFIELFEDKAIAAFLTIKNLISQNYEGLSLVWKQNRLISKFGKRTRLTVDSGSDWWQRITINGSLDASTQVLELDYQSSTLSAREEKMSVKMDYDLFKGILKSISTDNQWNSEDSGVIFEMVIPNTFKENISNRNSLLFVIDDSSASIPWELLQPGMGRSKPLCVSSKLIRQYSTKDFRVNPLISKSNSALVIGDPNLQGADFAPQLPSAAREAETVHSILAHKLNDKVDLLLNSEGIEIAKKLVTTDCKILHIAAHGIYDSDTNRRSGIIIGKSVIGEEEYPRFIDVEFIEQMPYTPELIFVNCCYSGTVGLPGDTSNSGKVELAASIGIKWIKKGAKAIVITGWSVNDSAAEKFAEVFYNNMTNGVEFGSAVRNARSEVYAHYPNTNTWGAYQCYGDPFYKLYFRASTTQENIIPYNLEQEALNAIENLNSKIEIDFYSIDDLRQELNTITKRIKASFFRPEREIKSGIIEKLAFAYANLGMDTEAISYFEALIQNKALAYYSMKTVERYLSVKYKKIIRNYLKGKVDSKIQNSLVAEMMQLEQMAENYTQITQTPEFFIQLGNIYRSQAILETDGTKMLELLQKSVNAYKKVKGEVSNQRVFQAYYNQIIVTHLLSCFGVKARGAVSFHRDFETELNNYAKQRGFVYSSFDEYWEKIRMLYATLTRLIVQWSKLNNEEKETTGQIILKQYRSVFQFGRAAYRRQYEIDYLNVLIVLLERSKNDKGLNKYLTGIRDAL